MTPLDRMTPLERRYRRVLRLLPASYRAAWEEEMVAAFLESMATTNPEDSEFLAEYGSPSRSEVASVAALAVRLRVPLVQLRLGVPGAPPRYAASSDGVRRAALALVLLHASFATVGLGTMLWLLGLVPRVPHAPVEWTQPGLIGRGYVTFTLLDLAWLVAYLALVFGYRRVAWWSACVAVATSVSNDIGRYVLGAARSFVTLPSTVLFGGLLLVALLAFHRDAPALPVRRCLASLGAGIGMATGFLVLVDVVLAHLLTDQRHVALNALLDWAGVYSVLLVAAAVPYLLVVLVRPARRGSPWSLAFALLAAAALGLRLVTLAELPSQAVGLGLSEALVVAALCLPLAALARNTLRRLSPVRSDARERSLG
jgi:hypothetical protein